MPESGFFRSIFGRSRTFHHHHHKSTHNRNHDFAPQSKHPSKKKEEQPPPPEEDPAEEVVEEESADTVSSSIRRHRLSTWREESTSVSFAEPESANFSPTSLRRSSTYHHRHTLSTPTGTRVLIPRWGKKVVLYTTSLATIRRTYEDCRAVKMVLKGLRVAVDERDLAMDASYRREMLVLLGGRQLSLPRAFVGRKCIGGVDEILLLHEDGELEKLLDKEGVAREEPGFLCRNCGGLKFLPCDVCDGSRKVFDDDEDRLRRCSVCNENGLVRCPNCS